MWDLLEMRSSCKHAAGMFMHYPMTVTVTNWQLAAGAALPCGITWEQVLTLPCQQPSKPLLAFLSLQVLSSTGCKLPMLAAQRQRKRLQACQLHIGTAWLSDISVGLA